MTLVWNAEKGHFELLDNGEFLVALSKADLPTLAGQLLGAMGLEVEAYPALVDYLHVEDGDPVRKDPTPFEAFGWKQYHL